MEQLGLNTPGARSRPHGGITPSHRANVKGHTEKCAARFTSRWGNKRASTGPGISYRSKKISTVFPKKCLGTGHLLKYVQTGNVSLYQEVREASRRSSQRTTKSISRRIRTSVYRKGEKELIRCPPWGGSRLAPRRKYTCKGVVEERKLAQNKYKVRFERPDGKMDRGMLSSS